MTKSYSHSEVFSQLKNTKEEITKSLTSYQYLTVLDDLLYSALTPIVKGTKFFEVFLSQIIGWQTLNPKRKTCAVGRHQLVSLSTLLFLTNDGNQKMKLVRRMKLHRNILFEAINRWTDLMSDYPSVATLVGTREIVERMFELNEIALIRPGFSLHSTYTTSIYWVKQARSFREKIIQKYTRMCITTAQRDYVDMGHAVRLDDMIQIYMMTVGKAIDKCDADRGVLTTHIQNWLMSAKNNVQKMAAEDSAGTDSDGHAIHNISFDDIDAQTPDTDNRERNETIERVRTVAKIFDPQGYGRILLGIQEQLTPSDLQTLHSLTIKEVELEQHSTVK